MIGTQRKNLWSKFAYTLALAGTLVIVISGFNLFLQRGQATGSQAMVQSQAWNNTDTQIETLQSRLVVRPQHQESYVLLGGAYLQKARETGDKSYYAIAEETLQQALELDAESARAMSLLGALSLERHDFQEASEWAQAALEVNPAYPAAYGVLSDAQLEQGQYDAAMENVQKMVDLKPNLDSYSRVAYIRELMGDVDGAIEAMEVAVAAGSPGSENTAWAQVQLGDLYFESGRVDQAEVQYEAAMREFPGYHEGLAALGKVRAVRGEYSAAIELYRQAIDIAPELSLLAELGDLYTKLGETDLAQQQYDAVVAMAQLEAANGQVYNRELVHFYLDHDMKLEQALELATLEMEVRQDIHGYDTLAWALYKNDRPEEAAAAMSEALRLGTRDAELHYHAGKIFERVGDPERTATHLKRALEINPQFSLEYAEDSRQTLSRLTMKAAA